MTTSNLGLKQSTVGVTEDPTWANNIEDNWTTIDAHDHSSGKGKQIAASGIDIDGDVDFGGNSATNLESVQFASHLTGGGGAPSGNYAFFWLDGELWWRNGAGVAFQMSTGGGTQLNPAFTGQALSSDTLVAQTVSGVTALFSPSLVMPQSTQPTSGAGYGTIYHGSGGQLFWEFGGEAYLLGGPT